MTTIVLGIGVFLFFSYFEVCLRECLQKYYICIMHYISTTSSNAVYRNKIR